MHPGVLFLTCKLLLSSNSLFPSVHHRFTFSILGISRMIRLYSVLYEPRFHLFLFIILMRLKLTCLWFSEDQCSKDWLHIKDWTLEGWLNLDRCCWTFKLKYSSKWGGGQVGVDPKRPITVSHQASTYLLDTRPVMIYIFFFSELGPSSIPAWWEASSLSKSFEISRCF